MKDVLAMCCVRFPIVANDRHSCDVTHGTEPQGEAPFLRESRPVGTL